MVYMRIQMYYIQINPLHMNLHKVLLLKLMLFDMFHISFLSSYIVIKEMPQEGLSEDLIPGKKTNSSGPG